MNKKITIGILALGLVALSFKMATDKTTATVEQINGISVFAFAKPTSKYDILGTIKIKGIVKSERGGHMTKLMAEKAKAEYPSADGIIVATEDWIIAEVIRFRE